ARTFFPVPLRGDNRPARWRRTIAGGWQGTYGNWRGLGQTMQRPEGAMDVGMMMVFASYGWDDCSDERVWDEEIRLARLAADLGFDCLWSAEHHFNNYSFVPDNLQLLRYLTALCPNVDLGTAAVIVPWHDPLR